VTRRRPPRRPDLTNGEPWRVEIEAIEPSLVLGRWLVYIARGVLRYGPDGYGWTTWTLAGARRKGARELRRLLAREARLAARAALLDRAGS